MNSKFLLTLSLFLLIVFSACNKGGKTGLLIPKDAALVVHLDLSSLSSKLTWKEIQQTSWFTEAQKQTNDSLAKKLLADPGSSGVDVDNSLVMFMKRTGNNGYVAFEGKLKDAEKFKTTIQQAAEGKAKIEKDGEFNVASMDQDNGAVLYFNDKIFVFVTDASDTKRMTPNQSMPEIGGSSQKYSMDSLKYFAKSTFSLKGKDLLDSDERFANLISDKADMHYWMNSGYLYSGMMGGPLAMMKIGDVLTDNISLGKANFENGKIVFDSDQFYNEKLADLFKKYSGKKISNDVLNRLPDGNVLAAFAMNYNPEGIKELLKLLGVDGMANAALGQMGINFTVDDFVKANAGELAFALTDFTIKEVPASVTIDEEGGQKEISYTDKKPEMKFVFGVSVNDQASFQKLIDGVAALKNQEKFNMQSDSAATKTVNKIQGKWFALGSGDAEVNSFLEGKKSPGYAAAISGHNGGGYVDLQKFILAASAGNKGRTGGKMFDISAGFWKNINMFWDLKGKNATSHFEINLADGKTNSLKQLNQYFDKLYMAKPDSEVTEDAWMADSIATPAPEPAQ